MQYTSDSNMHIKTQIQLLINEGKIGEAENLILKAEKIDNEDLEIISMKAVILIMLNNLEEAEKVLRGALTIDKNNPDILFNLAYIYEIKGQYEEAYKYYIYAKGNSKDDMFVSNVEGIINNLREYLNLNTENHNRQVGTSIIIMINKNLNYAKLCVDSIRKYTKSKTYEIIIVSNNSNDTTIAWIMEQNDIKVILINENMGFFNALNTGIKAAQKDNDLLLIDNDTIVTPRWLENLNKCLYSDEYIGAVEAISNNYTNKQDIKTEFEFTEEMLAFADKYNMSDTSKWEQRTSLTGVCTLIKRSILNKIGISDESSYSENIEYDDLEYKIKCKGYKLFLCKDTFIYHFENTSYTKEIEYILRRIENSISVDDNLKLLINYLDKINYKTLNDIIMKKIIKKEMVFNAIAMNLFNNCKYADSLKILELAYKYNCNNKDTVYNISHIIYQLGDKETAISYLDLFLNRYYDTDIIKLKKEILGDTNE